MIFYDHHQSRIVVVCIATLFSQLPDCIFSIRKRRRYIRQVRAIRIILDPIPSVYREEISRHNALSCRVVKIDPNGVGVGASWDYQAGSTLRNLSHFYEGCATATAPLDALFGALNKETDPHGHAVDHRKKTASAHSYKSLRGLK